MLHYSSYQWLVSTVGLVLLSAASASASEPGGTSAETEKTSTQSPDFLFGRPGATIGIRASWLQSRSDSEIFDFTTEFLTLTKNAFNGPGIIVDLGVPMNNRADVLFAFEYNHASALSEDRDFVEDNDQPIEQTTTFRQVNLTANVELALLPRGREIGRYAWIPSTVVPYVGGGAGLLWYQFGQEGDFVDYDTLAIFTDRLTSSGWTPSAHLFGGVDVKLTQRLFLSGEARYVWAHTPLEGPFIDFDDIDLAGFRITGGVQFVF